MIRRDVCAAMLLLSWIGGGAAFGAESWKELRAWLKKDPNVEVSRAGGTIAVTIKGETAPAFDQSVAARLGRHYIGDKKFRGAAVSGVAPSNNPDRWSEMSKRCGVIAKALHRQGVPEAQIAVFVTFDPKAPPGGRLTISLHSKRNWFQRAGANLVGGVTDVVMSPTEIPRGMVRQGRKRGVAGAGTVGVVGGIGSTVRRAGNGAIKLLTFWAG